ncbi:MAG: hypothetical protein RLZZ511_566 [Cyanobacteriota bacterium]|jgi:glutaminase
MLEEFRRTDRLSQGTARQYQQWLEAVRPLTVAGELPQYVPELARLNPATLALAVQSGWDCVTVGDVDCAFSLMSLMKPFLLLYGLETAGGGAVFERVGTRPSDQPFHSLKQLAADRGQPRNPMVNSGAMSLVELLPGRNGNERRSAFQAWVRAVSGLELAVDPTILASVRSLPNDANQAIAQMLKNNGQLRNRATVLDTYNQLCCLSVTVDQLAALGQLLALPQDRIQRRSQQIVNALMLTCGVYEASGDWAVRIGLPTKSGVSGGILAIVPGEGAIAIYAPMIDATGNSIAGAALLQAIVENLGLGVF